MAKAPDVPETPVVEATKETHNALIAREAELSVLASGRDRMDGVLAVFNGQEAGIFTFADLGGSKDRYDTGSHATTHALETASPGQAMNRNFPPESWDTPFFMNMDKAIRNRPCLRPDRQNSQ